MNTLSRAAEVIRQAERDIRALLAEAASSAEHDELLVLADWVKRLRELLAVSGFGSDHQRSDSSPAQTVPIADGALKKQEAVPDGASAAVGTGGTLISAGSAEDGKPPARSQRKKRMAKRAKRSGAKPSEYPRFRRDGDHLVKIGWSKREKAQYEHKAPKRVLDLLVGTLARTGGSGHRFATEDVLPLEDGADHSEVPSYQAYLCLAWLRSVQLVEQHGRQGYSLTHPEQLAGLVDAYWDKVTRG